MAEVKEISVESAEKPIENGHVAPEEPTAGSSRSRRVQFSPQSIPIINEAHRLLNAKPSGTPTIDINTYKSDSDPTELTKSSTLTALNRYEEECNFMFYRVLYFSASDLPILINYIRLQA